MLASILEDEDVTPARIGAVIAVPLATAVVTAAQLNLPTKEVWQHPTAVAMQWASIAILALFIFDSEVRQVTHLVRASRVREYDLDLRAELSQLLCAVVDLTGARWDEIEVTYYRLRRNLFLRRRLVRVASLRLGAGTSHTAASWTIRTGVVGTAFAAQEAIGVDWASFTQQAVAGGKGAWEQLPVPQRYGMNWGQLISAGTRAQGVLAVPTFERGSGLPTGCILLSGALKLDDLNSEGMRHVLGDLATALDRLGSPPRGWWTAHEL
ncbi:hypothetical protein [Actinoplanes sp. NPDC020271]|uniref:hypothetical protein n=1 Tax=Actinoplanes sp. NPDC020271 TaxID=3363896 RepID=UPI0037A55B43